MAERGKPLPIVKREEIRSMRPSQPLREVAAKVGVSINTVRKYERKFDTK